MYGFLAEGQVAASLSRQLQRPLGLVERELGLDADGAPVIAPSCLRSAPALPAPARRLWQWSPPCPCPAAAAARSSPRRPWLSLRPLGARRRARPGNGRWRGALSSCSAASRMRASSWRVFSATSFSRSAWPLLITASRLFSSLARPTACHLSSGKAEDSSMALRTMVKASSRRVTITGGGLRPILCRAASSAERVPWRSSSVPRSFFSSTSSSASFASILLSSASLCWMRLPVSSSRSLMRSCSPRSCSGRLQRRWPVSPPHPAGSSRPPAVLRVSSALGALCANADAADRQDGDRGKQDTHRTDYRMGHVVARSPC